MLMGYSFAYKIIDAKEYDNITFVCGVENATILSASWIRQDYRGTQYVVYCGNSASDETSYDMGRGEFLHNVQKTNNISIILRRANQYDNGFYTASVTVLKQDENGDEQEVEMKVENCRFSLWIPFVKRDVESHLFAQCWVLFSCLLGLFIVWVFVETSFVYAERTPDEILMDDDLDDRNLM